MAPERTVRTSLQSSQQGTVRHTPLSPAVHSPPLEAEHGAGPHPYGNTRRARCTHEPPSGTSSTWYKCTHGPVPFASPSPVLASASGYRHGQAPAAVTTTLPVHYADANRSRCRPSRRSRPCTQDDLALPHSSSLSPFAAKPVCPQALSLGLLSKGRPTASLRLPYRDASTPGKWRW